MNVYYLLLENLVWNEKDSRLLRFVSPERQRDVLIYKSYINQKLSLYSALIIRMQISKKLGMDISDQIFQHKKNYKPQLLAIEKLDFSISHSGHFILCGINKRGFIGVDVEKIQKSPLDIMHTCFHKEEIAYVNEARLNEKDSRFFEIWTKKEAYLKKIGIGLSCNLVLCNTFSRGIIKHQFFWNQNGYMCAVCADEVTEIVPVKISEDDLYQFFLT